MCAKRDTEGKGNTRDSACQHCHNDIKPAVCMYIYTHTHYVVQHRMDLHSPSPIPMSLSQIPWGQSSTAVRAHQCHHSTRLAEVTVPYCLGQTQLPKPHGHQLFSPRVMPSLRSLSVWGQGTTDWAHRQRTDTDKMGWTLQAFLHSSLPSISGPSVSTPDPLLQAETPATLPHGYKLFREQDKRMQPPTT